MQQWTDGKWTEIKDPREAIGDKQYEEWMDHCGYTNIQTFGDPHGYGYVLWGNENKTWIISVGDGISCEEFFVDGYINLVGLMSHIGTGAIASVLDGEEIGEIFEERRVLKKMSQNLMDKIRNPEPCQCPKCVERRESERAMN